MNLNTKAAQLFELAQRNSAALDLARSLGAIIPQTMSDDIWRQYHQQLASIGKQNHLGAIVNMNPNARYLISALSMTYEQARYWHNIGLLDDTDWELYQFYWQNSAPRDPESVCARYQVKG